jgi:hypothetical protein
MPGESNPLVRVESTDSIHFRFPTTSDPVSKPKTAPIYFLDSLQISQTARAKK